MFRRPRAARFLHGACRRPQPAAGAGARRVRHPPTLAAVPGAVHSAALWRHLDHRPVRSPVVRGPHPARVLRLRVWGHGIRRHPDRARHRRAYQHEALLTSLASLIVDGYNVIHAWPSLKRLMSTASLEDARDELVRRVAVMGLITGESVTVVFDAHHSSAMTNSEETVEGVRVVFTRKGHSADHAIERLAYGASNRGEVITVATSDRFQSDLVRGMGGAVISAPELERRVIEAEQEMTRRVKRYQ
ncbi:MAG: NYN domain-containing protein [Chloroflexi bacterium]|nr:MAG: NYN domain-containing protein [Chloroflexota bacterium]